MPVPVTPSKVRGEAPGATKQPLAVALASASGPALAAPPGRAVEGQQRAAEAPAPGAAHSRDPAPPEPAGPPRPTQGASPAGTPSAAPPASARVVDPLLNGAEVAPVAEPLGELLPGATEENPARPELKWDGRWGKWGGDSSVYIASPHVAQFDLTYAAGITLDEAIDALQVLLRKELVEEPPSRVLLHVHDASSSSTEPLPAGSAVVQAGMMCKAKEAKKLKAAWQARTFLEGAASATWTLTEDTASKDHVERVKQERAAKGAFDAAALEIPRSWLFRVLPLGNVAQLPPSSHWHLFARIFGEVKSAEIVWNSPFDTEVHLLVRYRRAQDAGVMYEMLSRRYLWNPKTQKPHHRGGDGYAVVLTLGDLNTLRARFVPAAVPTPQAMAGVKIQDLIGFGQPPPRQAVVAGAATPAAPSEDRRPASGPIYVLRRQGPTPVVAPESILVTGGKPVTVGREDTCDFVVPMQHMSRVHAQLRLIAEAKGNGREVMLLWIQDKSTNGIWVNEKRMAKGTLVQLHDQDRISFQAQDLVDPPTYRVHRYRDVAHAEAAGPVPMPLGQGQASVLGPEAAAPPPGAALLQVPVCPLPDSSPPLVLGPPPFSAAPGLVVRAEPEAGRATPLGSEPPFKQARFL